MTYNSKKSLPKNPKIDLLPAYQRIKELKQSKDIVSCDMFERQKIMDKNKYEKLKVLKSIDFEKEYS